MQRHTIASLVALQCVVACGCAVEAQDATTRPAYARSSASRESTAALAGSPRVRPSRRPSSLPTL
jgi:hypothetical protein